jgi:large subunit ribosomal protein L29
LALKKQAVNKMKANEVKKLSDTELEAKLGELKKDLFFLRMQHATNQLDNPIRIAQVRRDIARVKTVIRQKQLGL